jgi:CP family cyanate transporter-like MFS transporter
MRKRPVLLGLAIVLVAVNLRPALASVGPVLDDLGLSDAVAAVLTAVPVVCLGAVAAAAPALARRWGLELVVAFAVAAVGTGLLVRVVDGVPALFAGTILAAGAIAVANVLLPALIKRDFAEHSGPMMGLYSMALSGSAAVAAGATVPLGEALDRGWRGALAVWAVPAVVALLTWLPFTRRHIKPALDEVRRGGSLLRDTLAWQVTIFFGLQSLLFYAVLAWLPSYYRDQGFRPAVAGLLLSVSTLVQVPVTLLLPALAGRMRDQRLLAVGCTLFTVAGLTGVLLAPTRTPYLWMVLLGIGQGGTFAVGLTLFVLRTRTALHTARLSALAQTFGYLLAATGPLLVGLVHDATGSWTPALGLLLLLAVPQVAAGLLAGRARTVAPMED